ncbi:hypothetical protein [Yinghuangia seranimata]|uniref:hypothetical protein n=1 Tax=Yinghuangia seranimata TaxID=408067 RepID=UPI00248D2AAD|nr:hypothetical protein [Yinghuangia seranimata]MDI2131304.1 hypothetical protein [Yinghuangia seranimata]
MPKPTAPVPPDAQPDGEPNRHLARFKTSLAKRWSHTRMTELYETLDLSLYLWALDRDDEALGVLGSVTSAVTTPIGRDGLPNYNVWSPVVAMNALEARILRLAGNPQAAATPAARLASDPGLAPNRDFITDKITDAQGELDAAATETSVKWACHKLARRTGTLVLYAELAAAAHPYAAWSEADDVERLITTGRTHLRTRLTAAA